MFLSGVLNVQIRCYPPAGTLYIGLRMTLERRSWVSITTVSLLSIATPQTPAGPRELEALLSFNVSFARA